MFNPHLPALLHSALVCQGAGGGEDAEKEFLPGLQGEPRGRDVDREGGNRLGKVLEEADRSIAMSRGRASTGYIVRK